MATLHVRNIPEELYAEVQQLAAAESRSVSAEIVSLLAQAVEERRRRANHIRALDSLRRRRFTPPAGTPDAMQLLREDRER